MIVSVLPHEAKAVLRVFCLGFSLKITQRKHEAANSLSALKPWSIYPWMLD